MNTTKKSQNNGIRQIDTQKLENTKNLMQSLDFFLTNEHYEYTDKQDNVHKIYPGTVGIDYKPLGDLYAEWAKKNQSKISGPIYMSYGAVMKHQFEIGLKMKTEYTQTILPKSDYGDNLPVMKVQTFVYV